MQRIFYHLQSIAKNLNNIKTSNDGSKSLERENNHSNI